MSRRNGELEATVRKLRSAARDVDSERERLMARIQILETQACQGSRIDDFFGRDLKFLLSNYNPGKLSHVQN